MKLRYLSDLHLEFISPKQMKHFIKKIPSNMDEICILAGDIGNPYTSNYDIFMKFISNHFKKTFVIPGNHEYYNTTKTIHETNVFMSDYFRQFKNITFLNNHYEIYENICFIGTTLWTRITNPKYKINDVHNIPHFDHIEYNKLHEISVEFLEDVLQNQDNCVVITHHMPSDSLIHEKYTTKAMKPYNQWFACNMEELVKINKHKIKCWIYGHTHTPSYVMLHEIPFICNPVGYPNENENINFEASITIKPLNYLKTNDN
jgi:predicted phosphohydrolase